MTATIDIAVNISRGLWGSLLFVVLPTAMLMGQSGDMDMNVTKFTKENGLPHSSVTGLAYDTTGTLWIGTKGGLCTFDGDGFAIKNLNVKRNSIKNICSDKDGMLWILTTVFAPNPDSIPSLYIYNPYIERLLTSEELKKYTHFDELQYGALIMSKGFDEIISIVNENGQAYFLREKVLIKTPTIGSTGSIIGLRSNRIDISYWDPKRNKKIILNYDLDTIAVLEEGELRDGNYSMMIWTGILGSKYIQIPDTIHPRSTFEVDFSPEKTGFPFSNLRFDKLVCGVKNNLMTYDLRTREVHNHTDEIRTDYPTFDLLAILQQDRQSFWVASYDGLYFISESPNHFRSFLTNQNLQTRNLLEVGQDSLLVATTIGAHLLDLKSNTSIFFRLDNKGIFGLSQVDKDNYLVGLDGFQLYLLNIEKNQSEQIYSQTGLASYKAVSIKDIIYVGTNKGVKILTSEHKMEDLPFGPELPTVSDLIVLSDTSFYALTNSGLYKIDLGIKEVKSLPSLEDYKIKCIHVDNVDTTKLWLGTQYHGIIQYSLMEGILGTISTENGLSNDAVHGIYADSLDRLWVSTDEGINVLPRNRKEIIQIKKTSGFATDEFNSYSSTQMSDGKIAFGSINGVTAFDPNTFVFPQSGGTILLDKLVGVKNNMEITANIENEKAIIVSKSLRDIRLHLKNEISSSGRTYYKYLMPGIKNDWSYLTANMIALPDLDYGNHQIMLSKTNNLTSWSSPEVVQLIVKRPFYLTSPFWGLLAVGLFLLTLLYLNQVRKRAFKRELIIKQKVDQQTIELADTNRKLKESILLTDNLFRIIGHDLRSPLLALQNISKSYSYLVAKDDHEGVSKLGNSIEKSTSGLLDVVNRLLDWSNSIKTRKTIIQPCLVGSVVEQVLVDLRTPIENKQLLVEKELRGDMRISSERESLVILLRNLLLNAVKYSYDGGRINLSVSRDQRDLTITIIDHGIGMSTSKIQQLNSESYQQDNINTKNLNSVQGLGIGLQICKHIVTRLNATMQIEQNLPKGTKVTVTLPQRMN